MRSLIVLFVVWSAGVLTGQYFQGSTSYWPYITGSVEGAIIVVISGWLEAKR